jgi:hypothetical protein
VPIAQQTIHSYPIQTPIDLNNTNLISSINTIPPTFVGHIDVPKLIEQTQFLPSPISVTNGTKLNVDDPTSSLKRLLKIRSQTGSENMTVDDTLVVFPKPTAQQNSVDLMPPSAFEPIATTPPSPVVAIGAERVKHRASNSMVPAINRENFRNVLLHLIQNDDHFLDIIYQACLTHPLASQ